MTTTQSHDLIGQTVSINYDGLRFSVTIKDFKTSYGRERVLISPVSGSGEKWVNLDSLNITPKE